MTEHDRGVFIIMTGAYGNIGDGLIRRRVLSWVRDAGSVHAYVGNAPEEWVQQLGFADRDRVYRSRDAKKWMTSMIRARIRPTLVFDPGEVPLGKADLKSELIFLALTMVVRLRRGVIIRPPRGLGRQWFGTVAVHRLGCLLSSVTLWRNSRSRAVIRNGSIVPDIAFQEPFDGGMPWEDRGKIVVSLRGLRHFPDHHWIQFIRAFAERSQLRILFLSQVRDDESRLFSLWQAVGTDVASVEPWGDRSDLEQERVVRGIYRDAAYVISDRLHVLILAAVSGAVPLEIVHRPTGKAVEHFATIDHRHVSMDSTGNSVEDLLGFVTEATNERKSLTDKINGARSMLDEQESVVWQLVSA